MSDAPSTRKWQLHLSTAVLLAMAAGVLLFLNLEVRRDEFWAMDGTIRTSVEKADELHRILEEQGYAGAYIRVRAYGWPFETVCWREEVTFENGKLLVKMGSGRIKFWYNLGQRPTPYGWATPRESLLYLIFNSVIAMVLLFEVYLSSEWWIRRRERRGYVKFSPRVP
jgi:hypothetical protein